MDLFIISDRLKQWLEWISLFYLFLELFWIYFFIFSFRFQMCCTAVVKNAWTSMNPHRLLNHSSSSWHYKFAFFRIILLNLSFFILDLAHQSFWEKCSWMNDPGDLCSQVVLFQTKEVWISLDRSFEVSSEEDFDLSRCCEFLRWKVWKLDPFRHWVVSYKVCICINSCSFWFNVSWTITTIFSFRNGSLHYVIIFLCSMDFTEEPHGSGRHLFRQFLKRLLESVSLLFSKTDACPREDASFLHKILHIANGGRFRHVSVFIWLWRVKASFNLSGVCSLVVGNLFVGSNVFKFKEFV